MAVIAFVFAPGFFSPPNRRTSRLYRACSRPRTRIAAQAAWISIGLMQERSGDMAQETAGELVLLAAIAQVRQARRTGATQFVGDLPQPPQFGERPGACALLRP